MPFEARSTTQAWVITIVAGVLAVWVPGAVAYALNAAMVAGHSPPSWYFGFSMVWGLVGLVILFAYGVFTPAPALWGPPVVAGAASAVSTVVMFLWLGGGVQMMEAAGALYGFMVAAMLFGLVWGVAVTAGVAWGGAAVGRSRRRKQATRRTQEPPPLPSFEKVP